jgi:hypothetical protein
MHKITNPEGVELNSNLTCLYKTLIIYLQSLKNGKKGMELAVQFLSGLVSYLISTPSFTRGYSFSSPSGLLHNSRFVNSAYLTLYSLGINQF